MADPEKLTVLWATDCSHHGKSAFGLLREMILPVTGRLVELTVAPHATRPLLIARPGANEVKTVMIAYHGSANARKALRFLKRLSLPADARLVLVNVVEPFTLPEGTPPAYRRQAMAEAHAVNER